MRERRFFSFIVVLLTVFLFTAVALAYATWERPSVTSSQAPGRELVPATAARPASLPPILAAFPPASRAAQVAEPPDGGEWIIWETADAPQSLLLQGEYSDFLIGGAKEQFEAYLGVNGRSAK